MAALYTDPDLIARALDLEKRGYDRDAIAEQLGVSKSTVRKMVVPGWAEAERKRHAEFEKVRYPQRKDDPDYLAYQAKINNSDKHRERVRLRKAAREGREAGAPVPRATLDRRERVTAEQRRKAEAGRNKGPLTLSIEASLAVNQLMARRKVSYPALIEQLLLEAAAR